MTNKIKYSIDLVRKAFAGKKGSAAYWSVHMVANQNWKNANESLRHFLWRNAQYPGYIDLMPVVGQEGKVVLDYGCGPGNDVIGFAEFSGASQLIAVDVSQTAITAASKRLALHNKTANFIKVDENENNIPLQSESVDYIHSSGVLHHCANLEAIIKEFHRILKADGEISVMVYNYQSVWLHLYVAWYKQLSLGKYKGLAVRDAFRRTTDGENCPISHCYSPQEFIDIWQKFDFKGVFKGAAISLTELKCLDKRFDAIRDRRLPDEHREFLSALTFDNRGHPLKDGHVAGIDACYSFKKIN